MASSRACACLVSVRGVGHHQVGIGLVVRAADAAAQLVQLRQAELVGAADHDGVGAGHVDAGLDDGRAQQQVEALRDEVAHHLLELALAHLAVRHRDARLGHQLFEVLAPLLDRLDLVVQEVDLSAALQLAQHGLADQARALVAHEGLDRQPPLRRGGDHAQVAQALERHAQRARDRRGGQRQHVDLGAHRLDRLLVAHAEAVLLVDHQQAQALELHVLGQQLVRADHDVDAAVGHARQRGNGFLAGAKARQLGHLDRPLAEAVADRLVVLLGQQRGRRQQRDLLAAEHGDEGGAQRDLGLAEADVAADQPVHRLGRDHVLDHRVDGGALVRRFLEAEAGGEGLVVVRREAVRVAFAGGTPRIQVQQLRGGVAHLLGGTPLGLVPLPRAELVQRRLGRIDAGVAADQVQLRHRHVQRGVVGVAQVQELAGAVTEVEVDQSAVASDAVVGMHHRVADRQLRQVLDQRLDVARLPPGGAVAAAPAWRQTVRSR